MQACRPRRTRFHSVNTIVVALFSAATVLAIAVTFVGAFGTMLA